jgi:hypothetical protein
MHSKSKIQAIDHVTLTPFVRGLLGNKDVRIINHKCHQLSGGTVGDVFRFSGSADCDGDPVSWSIILKVLRKWERPNDPQSWKREALIYQSDLFNDLPGGLTVPRCHGIVTAGPDEYWLWLEDITGVHAEAMTLAQYQSAARHLAHFQGANLMGRPLPDFPWLSTERFFMEASKHWGTQAVAALEGAQNVHGANFPQNLATDIMRMWNRRNKLLDACEKLPRVVSHRDYNYANLFFCAGPNGLEKTVAIDWDCAGIGIAGEDIADLVSEALVFAGWPPEKSSDLSEAVLDSYLTGLQDVEWRSDDRLIRFGYAAAIAMHWSFRVVQRSHVATDTAAREHNIEVLRHLLKIGREAGYLLPNITHIIRNQEE